MADVSHTRGDMASHPDVSEMRDRYDRMLGDRDVTLLDGPVFLVRDRSPSVRYEGGLIHCGDEVWGPKARA